MRINLINEQLQITLEEGVPHAIVVQVQDANGQAIDLTDRAIKWQVRRSVDSPIALLDKSTDNGGIESGGVTGVFTIRINEDDLVDADWTSAVHDAKIVNLMRVFQGTVMIDRQVSI